MPPATSADPNHPRRWLILALIGVAQLMVVLDATIVNIALPSAQEALGFSDANRQWVVTAYALAFGSLLLIGGRIGDLFGRKRVFVAGLIGFAVASALGGAAGSFGLLVVARALQGVFGALLAPAALSLLTTTFADPAERGRAFGVFGAIAGSGAAIGLLLGGILTEYLSWRWCLYVNLAFALPTAIGALVVLVDNVHPAKPRLDVPGTLVSAVGLFALVYGFAEAEQDGWGAGTTIGFLVAGVALLGVFVALQRRVEHPLLPPRVVADRDRGGAYLLLGIMGVGMFGVFLFLTYYMQTTLGMSPIESGLGFLPVSFAISLAAGLATAKLMGKFGHKPLMVIGLVLSAIGMALLAQVSVDSSYLTGVLPGMLVQGVGFGLVIAPAMAIAVAGVDPHDAGVASAMANTTQQVGGSIGIALLSTLAASAVTSYLEENGPRAAAAAAVHGYTTAFWWSAGIFAVGAVVAAVLLKGGVRERDPGAAPAMAH
jgi:EmrB/QacA subfamily drug resistance transporter